MIGFLEIEASQLIEIMPFLAEAMPELQKREVDWKPEQVYGSLFLGLAQLTIIMDEEAPVGFVISRWMVQSQNNRNYLHIWLFYLTKEGRNKTQKITDLAIDYFWAKCQQNGAAYIEIPTTRGGWDKYLKSKMQLELLTFRKRA